LTSVAELGTFLSEKANNTPTTPYGVTLATSDISGIAAVLNTAGKYVNLNLSGSTFTSIGNGTFSNCASLAGITIPAGITSIENGAFTGCDNLTSVTFAGTIASGSFGNSAFPGDLAAKYSSGGAGTYTRVSGSDTWTIKLNPPSGGGNTNPKKITITGITGSYDFAMIAIFNIDDEDRAMGWDRISKGSVTVDLMNDDGTFWTGSGSYFVSLQLTNSEDDNVMNAFVYVYTNGKTFNQLGITIADFGDDIIFEKMPTFTISATVSTIAFSKFFEFPDDFFSDSGAHW
jgi:hypothetical protein